MCNDKNREPPPNDVLVLRQRPRLTLPPDLARQSLDFGLLFTGGLFKLLHLGCEVVDRLVALAGFDLRKEEHQYEGQEYQGPSAVMNMSMNRISTGELSSPPWGLVQRDLTGVGS